MNRLKKNIWLSTSGEQLFGIGYYSKLLRSQLATGEKKIFSCPATRRNQVIGFIVQYCFLFRFVCMELVSLIWFLQIWVAIYVYGTMINWSTLIKKLMQTYIVKVSGSILNISTVHLSGIWHLIWCYLSKPVLGGHPVSSGHYSIPRGVYLIQVSLYL